jgi:hypothetical protein
MSREGRAAHARNKARHAQREFGQEKPKVVSQAEGTRYMGAFVESVQGLLEFNISHPVTDQLGDTDEAKMIRLRELSKAGVLRMTAHREEGLFVEYRWVVTASATLAPRARLGR